MLVILRSLLEISLFTRVVYPQYMEQLIACYFSRFSVNLHSLMFTESLKLSKTIMFHILKVTDILLWAQLRTLWRYNAKMILRHYDLCPEDGIDLLN